MAWQLQEAKQQLSKVVDLAGREGPQVVTRHGREVAVVLSMDDYRALGGGDLKDALRGLADAGEGAFDEALGAVVADRARSLPPRRDALHLRFLLDTTAASQVGRRGAPEAVRRWLDGVAEDDLALSVLSLGEMRRGIELVRRRDVASAAALDRRLDVLLERLAGRLLEVTAPVADRWGLLSSGPEPVPAVDGLIAATALVHGLTVVTRNEDDFRRCGAPTLNPWTEDDEPTRR